VIFNFEYNQKMDDTLGLAGHRWIVYNNSAQRWIIENSFGVLKASSGPPTYAGSKTEMKKSKY